MLRILFIGLILTVTTDCFAENNLSHDIFSCGISKVEIFNSDDAKQPYFSIKISNAHQSISLKYSVRNEFLFARCDADLQKNPVILLNHFCGGTGCSESNFGIINAQTLEVLLTPSQDMPGNGEKALKIMGGEIKPFSCKTFSKTSEGSQHNGEFCYISPIELGVQEGKRSDLIFSNNRLHTTAGALCDLSSVYSPD